jgi:excisionase family DNA binding protein
VETAIEPAAWLSPKAAAALTGMSVSYLYANALKSGELRIARLGRSVRIDRTSILSYVERRAEQTSREAG